MVMKSFSINFFAHFTLIFISTTGIHCNQLNVLHYPVDHVKFVKSETKLETSAIPATFLSLLGLSIRQPIKWDGLLEGNIFKRPKAIVLFDIDSTKDITIKNSVISYGLQQDTGDVDIDSINKKLESVNWKNKPLLLDTSVDNQIFDVKSNYPDFIFSKSIDGVLSDLDNSNWMKSHKTGSLSTSSDLESTFIGELFMVTNTIMKLKENPNILKTNSPNFFHFKISALKSLEDKESYGDAINLLVDTINEVNKDLVDLFAGNIVITTAILNPNLDTKLKFGRHLQESNSTQSSFNRAPKYTFMYPVIFNIVLWFGIAFTVALIWISWSIWHMDPGRDSVIYRMTTQRLKRD